MCSLLQTPSTAIFTKWAVPQISCFILIDWCCLFVSHPYVQCSCILYLGYLTNIFIGRVWYREEKFECMHENLLSLSSKVSVFSHGIYILQYFSCNGIVGVDSLPNSRQHFLNWLSAFKHLAPLYICYCFLKSCSEWRILSNITNIIGYSSQRNLKVNERVQMHLEKVYMHIDT